MRENADPKCTCNILYTYHALYRYLYKSLFCKKKFEWYCVKSQLDFFLITFSPAPSSMLNVSISCLTNAQIFIKTVSFKNGAKISVCSKGAGGCLLRRSIFPIIVIRGPKINFFKIFLKFRATLVRKKRISKQITCGGPFFSLWRY